MQELEKTVVKLETYLTHLLENIIEQTKLNQKIFDKLEEVDDKLTNRIVEVEKQQTKFSLYFKAIGIISGALGAGGGAWMKFFT